ncbi:MAG TPA: hypothetical protein VHA75_03960, partial [Rugosimonospora sp.]|nr:hypothetical protein [Rugosimonospora sp.]
MSRLSPRDREAVLAAISSLRSGSGGRIWFDAEQGMGTSTVLTAIRAQASSVGCPVTIHSGPATPIRESPVLVTAEDLHGADDATLLSWGRLARRPLPMLLIATARPASCRPPVRHMRELFRRQGRVVRLVPLEPEQVRALATDRLGGPPGPGLSAYLAAVRGNPGRLLALLDLLTGAGAVARRGDAFDVVDGDRAAAVLTDHVLGALPGRTGEVLRAAALLGPGFEPVELGLTTGLTPPEVAAALATATERCLIAVGPDGYAFTHDVVSQALARTASPDVREALHDSAARHHALHRSAPTTVATHLVARTRPSPWAVDWLLELPEPALLAPAVPALLGSAVRATPKDDHRWANLVARLAAVRYWEGAYDEAAGWALAARGCGPDSDLTARLTLIAGRALLRRGRSDDAVRILRNRGGGAHEASREAWLALALDRSGRAGEAATHAARAGRLAARMSGPGHARVLARAAATHALVRTSGAGPLLDVVTGVRAELTDADLDARELVGLLLADLIALHLLSGRHDRLRTLLAESARLRPAVGRGAATELDAAIAEANFHLGDWAEVDRAPGGRHGLTAVVALLRQDDAAAEALAHPALPGDPLNRYRLEATALRAEDEGYLALALALRLRGHDRTLGRRPARLDTMIDLARVGLAAGRPDVVERLLQATTADLGRGALPFQLAAIDCVQALLSRDAVGLLAAADHFERLGAPRQRGLALEEAA